MDDRARDAFHPQSQVERELAERLAALATEVTPREAFAERLEAELLGRWEQRVAAPQRRKAGREPVRFLSQHRWAAAAAALLVAATVALSILGPQRAWADLLHLLGYVPGVGFVDLEGTRVLAAPVEVTREGVTLRVKQVLAGPDDTKIVIRSEGLPPEDQLWPGGARQEGDLEPLLRLPDGGALSAGTWTLRLGGGTLEFPSLPDGVYRVTLELSRLPLVPAGAAPENWQVSLELYPATGELVAELFPEPYAPSGAEDTHQGITLRVLEVAHSPEETVLGLQVQWTDPDWRFSGIGDNRMPELRDDLGHVYHHAVASSSGSSVTTNVIRVPDPQQTTPRPAPELPTFERTQAFAPVSASAGQLTLWVDGVGFHVPVEDSFVVDLGDDPHVGDRWALDIDLTVAGFPVHISGARLIQEERERNGESTHRTLLEFVVDPVPDRNGRTLHGIGLAGDERWFDGTTGSYQPQSRAMGAGLRLRDDVAVPDGPIALQVDGADVAFHGPWLLTWSIPGAGEAKEARAVPAALRPEDAAQTHSGVTLSVDEVVRTDRLTAVQIEGETSLPGASLGWDDPMWGAPDLTLPWDPAARDATGGWSEVRYLYDAQGRHYGRTRGTTWQAPEEDVREPASSGVASETLFLEALQPFSRRATLHVPAVAVTLPGAAAFEVDVPAGRVMHPDVETPEQVSEPWAVDVPLEIGMYRLRLVEAQLREISGQTRLVLTADPVEGRRGNQWLAGFGLASVTGPGGEAIDLKDAYATAGPEGQAGGAYRVWVSLDVTDPATGTLQPGRYRVALDGVLVAVVGPWELTFRVP
jgi:hypothetical protein